MSDDKQKQEVSLIGRILSMEALLFLMGLFCLGSGFVTGETIQMFWGGIILTGVVVLHFVRKKDWKKHWQEQEEMMRRYEEMKRQKELEREKEKGRNAGE